MDPDSNFAHRVPSLDRILRKDWFRLVHRARHEAGCNQHLSLGGVVRDDVEREVGPVPTGASADEVHERHLKVVCCPERAVVGLIYRARAVVVEKAVRCLDIAVRRVGRGLD